jgi:ABC-2 type transport system permease protein
MGGLVATASLVWRRLRHDRTGLAFTFLLPVAVASVMVGIYTSEDTRVGVLVEQQGAVGDELVDRLEGDGLLDVRRYDDRDAMERAVRRRELTAGVVVPAGADTAAETTIELVGPPGVAAPGGIRSAVEAAVAETGATLQLGRSLVVDGSAETAIAAGTDALGDVPSAGVDADAHRDRRQASAAEALVAVLVLFVFMNTMGGASSLPDWRDLGILARARTTRASSASIAVGYGLGMTSYAFVEAVMMLATGRLVFGITWTSWPSLLVVVSAVSLAAGGLAVVVGTCLPSASSGITIAGPVAFLLAALGGAVWPLDLVGPTLRTIGHLTPHAWAVEALYATGASGDSLSGVGPALAVLFGGAVALLAVGGWRVQRIARRA